jgi:hypothetical protein
MMASGFGVLMTVLGMAFLVLLLQPLAPVLWVLSLVGLGPYG